MKTTGCFKNDFISIVQLYDINRTDVKNIFSQKWPKYEKISTNHGTISLKRHTLGCPRIPTNANGKRKIAQYYQKE